MPDSNPFRDRIDARASDFELSFKEAFLWGSSGRGPATDEDPEGEEYETLQAFALSDEANHVLSAYATILWHELGCYILPLEQNAEKEIWISDERDEQLANYAGHTAALHAMGHGISFSDRDATGWPEWSESRKEMLDKRCRAIAGGLKHIAPWVDESRNVHLN
jgi:hypothetical protein